MDRPLGQPKGRPLGIVVFRSVVAGDCDQGTSSLERDIVEGENPVRVFIRSVFASKKRRPFDESGCLGLQPKTGGRSHPKLNTSGRPIAKKYSDGKVKRTLKRRSKVLETVKRETNGTGYGKVNGTRTVLGRRGWGGRTSGGKVFFSQRRPPSESSPRNPPLVAVSPFAATGRRRIG